jgi:hypothetical protein
MYRLVLQSFPPEAASRLPSKWESQLGCSNQHKHLAPTQVGVSPRDPSFGDEAVRFSFAIGLIDSISKIALGFSPLITLPHRQNVSHLIKKARPPLHQFLENKQNSFFLSIFTMGKHRLKGTKKYWSKNEETVLFAWLDLSIEHHDIRFFQETIPSRLYDRWTLPEIEVKLRQRWKDFGAGRGKKWKDDIYNIGSSALTFDPPEREAILKTVQLFKDERLAQELAEPSRALRRRSARSSSQQASIAKSLYRRLTSSTPVNQTTSENVKQEFVGSSSQNEGSSLLEPQPATPPTDIMGKMRDTKHTVSHKNFTLFDGRIFFACHLLKRGTDCFMLCDLE